MSGSIDKIGGTMLSYYFSCRTRLWLYAHNMGMEGRSEDVSAGRKLSEKIHGDQGTELRFPGMKMNMRLDLEKPVLYRVRKSNRVALNDRYQSILYLSNLKKRGIEAEAVVEYPNISTRLHISPTEEDFRGIEIVKKEISNIVKGRFPMPERKKICERCSYYEFCFGGSA